MTTLCGSELVHFDPNPISFIYLSIYRHIRVAIISEFRSTVFIYLGTVSPEVRIGSVKPFKSKNRDNIDLDAKNTNLKKSYDSRATTGFIGWKARIFFCQWKELFTLQIKNNLSSVRLSLENLYLNLFSGLDFQVWNHPETTINEKTHLTLFLRLWYVFNSYLLKV